MQYDVFNGDADGICALLQLRQTYPCESHLVSGVKREIDLLKYVSSNSEDQVTVLDISLDKNRTYLKNILINNSTVLYVDHHFAGEIPTNKNLTVVIDESANVSTSALMNKYLSGSRPLWAAVGSYGDNLRDLAMEHTASCDLSADQNMLLEELGTYINYNGYGETLSDLNFTPQELFRLLEPYDSPFDFISDCSFYFQKLKQSYENDFSKALLQKPERATKTSQVYILPNQSWSKRIVGVFSNHLANKNPNVAHAVLIKNSARAFMVSVRAPKNRKFGASDLCRQFPSGGGRKAAAGINDLDESLLANFISKFEEMY